MRMPKELLRGGDILGPPHVGAPKEKKKHYPILSIDQQDLDGSGELTFGQTLTVTATVKVIGIMEHEEFGGDDVVKRVELEVHKLSVQSGPADVTQTDDED